LNARVFRLAALAVTLLVPTTAQVAILQIRFVEGDGGVHAPGRRVARPLTVEVADETGKPIAGATVSFHLPDDGAGGAFPDGMHTGVSITDAQGRAAMAAIHAPHTPGTFQIRVVVVKEQARAGAVSAQYVAEPAAAAAGHGRGKWVAIAAVVGGGMAAGVLSAGRKAPSAPAAPAPPVAAALSAPPVSIGTPVSTVGKP
jgi:hypothetical protein